MFSFHGDTVLDPFCGSGTTMIAAMRCNRNSVGIEIDPAYCRMAMQRLQNEASGLFSQTEVAFIGQYGVAPQVAYAAEGKGVRRNGRKALKKPVPLGAGASRR